MRNRQNEWVFRLNEEMRVSPYSYFFTLTYRDDALSFACYVPERLEFPCLSHDDIKKFMKRLRKNTKVRFKYHLVGEYGPNTLRPHYHGLIFAQSPLTQEQVMSAWQKSDLVRDVFEMVYDRSALGYVTKYLCKIPFLPDYIRNSERMYRPFSQCSNGLGLTYLETNSQLVDKVLSQEEDFVILDGVKYPMPRYYKDKLFDDATRDRISMRKNNESVQRHYRQYLDFLSKNGLEADSKGFLTYENYQKMCLSDAWRRAFKKFKQHKEKL